MSEPEEKHLAGKFGGLATFFSGPQASSLDNLDIAMVGVPYDGAVTNRPGARHGPREMRNQSTMIRDYNQLSKIAPFKVCSIADVGDVDFRHIYDVEKAHGDIQAFYERIHAAGVIPISAGGDHSVTLPILRAIAADRPVAMIHFDAHCDTSDGFMDSKFHHGAPFRWAVEEGLIDPKKTVQIGIRGSLGGPDTWQYSHDVGMRVVYMDEFQARGWKSVIEEASEIVGEHPVYVTFDVDGLDPAFAPGTGTPEVGGFSNAEALAMLRAMRGMNIIGGDVVEVAPPFDQSGTTALVGATMMFEILCLTAANVHSRQSE